MFWSLQIFCFQWDPFLGWRCHCLRWFGSSECASWRWWWWCLDFWTGCGCWTSCAWTLCCRRIPCLGADQAGRSQIVYCGCCWISCVRPGTELTSSQGHPCCAGWNLARSVAVPHSARLTSPVWRSNSENENHGHVIWFRFAVLYLHFLLFLCRLFSCFFLDF